MSKSWKVINVVKNKDCKYMSKSTMPASNYGKCKITGKQCQQKSCPNRYFAEHWRVDE